jgi:hypothetical protein
VSKAIECHRATHLYRVQFQGTMIFLNDCIGEVALISRILYVLPAEFLVDGFNSLGPVEKDICGGIDGIRIPVARALVSFVVRAVEGDSKEKEGETCNGERFIVESESAKGDRWREVLHR